jgi:hypothetical protein
MALKHRVGWDPAFARRSPWFWPLAAAAEHFTASPDWPSRADLDRMYAHRAGRVGEGLLHFAPNVSKQARRSAERVALDRLYDGSICVHAAVPTREQDWHDFFNALCFATFPRAKLALHRRQYLALCERIDPSVKRLPATRTSEQDALTLFDEGGAVIAAAPSFESRLLSADSEERPSILRYAVQAGAARVIPFGHALFEHWVEGLRCPGGSTRIVALHDLHLSDAALLDAVDSALAIVLADRSKFQHPREGAHVRLAASLELSAELVR